MKYEMKEVQFVEKEPELKVGLWLGTTEYSTNKTVLVLVNEYAKTITILDKQKLSHVYDGGNFWSEGAFELRKNLVTPLPVGQRVEFWNDKEIKND